MVHLYYYSISQIGVCVCMCFIDSRLIVCLRPLNKVMSKVKFILAHMLGHCPMPAGYAILLAFPRLEARFHVTQNSSICIGVLERGKRCSCPSRCEFKWSWVLRIKLSFFHLFYLHALIGGFSCSLSLTEQLYKQSPFGLFICVPQDGRDILHPLALFVLGVGVNCAAFKPQF